MISKILFIKPGEFSKLLPFFCVYFAILTAFTLADGLSMSLLVMRMGVAHLPEYYALIGIANFFVVGLYMMYAERLNSLWVFQGILGLSLLSYLVGWWALTFGTDQNVWYGLLFASREIGFILVLMHFGTFLQEYFTRDEMNRILPIVYSAGRIGGISGGLLLSQLSTVTGLRPLLLVFVAILLVSMVALHFVARYCRFHYCGKEERSDSTSGLSDDLEKEARQSVVGFLKYVRGSQLLFWITVTTILFLICRWFLNFQYNTFFSQHFESASEMASFLGFYTQLAMFASLLIQLLLVNRLVAWFGVQGVWLLYASLLLLGMVVCAFPMTLGIAIFARLIESELRLGLRNPIMQLLTNKFSKAIRVRVRAWSLGFLTPVGTFCASLLLIPLENWFETLIPLFGVIAGALHFGGSLALSHVCQAGQGQLLTLLRFSRGEQKHAAA